MWTLILISAAVAGWLYYQRAHSRPPNRRTGRRRPSASRLPFAARRHGRRATSALRDTVRQRTRTPCGHHGAGASADHRARQLDGGLGNQIAAAVGITTRGHRQAANYRAGAEGERRTRDLLHGQLPGWAIFHDRALPTGKANLDHLVISPLGVVALPDSKQWTARHSLSVRGGRLWHGQQDVTGRLSGLVHETRTVSATLGVPVIPLVVMHGAPLVGPDGQPVTELSLTLSGMRVRIIPAVRAVSVLRRLDPGTASTPAAEALAAQARRQFPPRTSVRR